MSGYSIVRADDVEDAYAGSEVPGEFRSLKGVLDSERVVVTLIRVPPHSDFEQERATSTRSWRRSTSSPAAP